jgi:hypothetical protein
MNRSKEVEAWLEAYDNPMSEVVRRVRDIILRADHRIEESLQGEAPVFSYRGDLASVFPHSKKHASLMVHRGAEIPGHHPRLEGTDAPGRVMKIASVAEANAARDDLQHLVRSWCDWRDADAAPAEPAGQPEAPVRRPAAKKKGAAPRKKKTTRPAAKKARSKKGAARTAAKKRAPKKSSSQKRSAKPAAKTRGRRGSPRSRGR